MMVEIRLCLKFALHFEHAAAHRRTHACIVNLKKDRKIVICIGIVDGVCGLASSFKHHVTDLSIARTAHVSSMVFVS